MSFPFSSSIMLREKGPERKVNCTNLLKVLKDSEYMDMFLAKFEAIKYLMQT